MLTMSQINHIKDLSNCGYRISEISKKRYCQVIVGNFLFDLSFLFIWLFSMLRIR